MSRLAREITYKSLLRFAAPTILSFVFLNIYFIIDGVLVARAVGTAGLAAVNITMPVFGVMLALAATPDRGFCGDNAPAVETSYAHCGGGYYGGGRGGRGGYGCGGGGYCYGYENQEG